MDVDPLRHPLLTGRGLVLVAEFCRATGLDVATVEALVIDGRAEGAFRPDGELVGLFDDVLPTAARLRDWGLSVNADYDPDLLRSDEEQDEEDLEDESEDSGPAWTMGWGDDKA